MLLFRVILTLVLWDRKAGECFKHCLMGHISRSVFDNDADNEMEYWELA